MYIYRTNKKERNESKHVIFSTLFNHKSTFQRIDIRIYESLRFTKLASNLHGM